MNKEKENKDLHQFVQIKINDRKISNFFEEVTQALLQQKEKTKHLEQKMGKVQSISVLAKQQLQCLKKSNSSLILQSGSSFNNLQDYICSFFLNFQTKIKDKITDESHTLQKTIEDMKELFQEKIEKQVQHLNLKVKKVEEGYKQSQNVTSLMKNSCFLDFIQVLITQEASKKKSSKKQDETFIFSNQNQDLKGEFFEGLKKDITETQNNLKKLEIKVSKSFSKQKQEKFNEQYSNLQYAVLAAKVSELEKKMTQQHAPNIDKIMYPTKKQKGRRNGSMNLFNINQVIEQKKPVIERFDFKKEYFEKKIDQLYQRVIELEEEKDEIRISIKNDFEEQKRKKKEYDELKVQIFKIRQINYESQQLSILYKAIKRLEDSLEEKIENKVERKDISNFKEGVEKKIAIMNEAIKLKANKDEIKNALLFLEGKMKEIVMVLADFQRKNIEVIGSKQMLQCLSCDYPYFDEKLSRKENHPSSTPQHRCNTARTMKSRKTKLLKTEK